jgi:Domain of unknown function (DUF4136)
MRTAKNPLPLALLALVLASPGCSSMRIRTDYDPQADFAALHTYAWAPPTPGKRDLRVSDLTVERIHQAVDDVLRQKGYELASTGEPDFRIGYDVVIESKTDVRTMPSFYGPGWWGYGSDVYVDQYRSGTLILQIRNGHTGREIWRGSAEARVDEGASPEERTKRVHEAVTKILEHFPPQK